MRRLLISLLAIATFLGCNKDDYPNDVIRTLASAESWQELKTYAYTEPNGGGDSILLIDRWPLLGEGLETFSIEDGKFIRYIYADHVPISYYKEYVMTQDDTDPYCYTLVDSKGSYYLKILEYDGDNLMVEYDYKPRKRRKEIGGEWVEYGYLRTHFVKVTHDNKDWKKGYISEEEYINKYRP